MYFYCIRTNINHIMTTTNSIVVCLLILLVSCSDNKYQKLEADNKVKDSLLARLNQKMDSIVKQKEISQNRPANKEVSDNSTQSTPSFYGLVSFKYYGTKYKIDDKGVHVYNSKVFIIRDTSDDAKTKIIDAIVDEFIRGEGRMLVQSDVYDKKVHIKNTYAEASNSRIHEGETANDIMKRVLGEKRAKEILENKE